MRYKRRRTFLILLLALTVSVLGINRDNSGVLSLDQSNQPIKNAITSAPADSIKAADALERLAVKGRAPKTGYGRTMFMDDWGIQNSCDKRNIILLKTFRN